MITYDKSWWGNRVLFRAYGSAFPRALPYACVAAAIAATLSALFDTTGWELFSNAYPVQIFFFVVGFMVIFRNNLAYGRYWEGRSQLQQITANLSDAVCTAINFDRNALPKEGATREQQEQHEWFCDTFVHLISLFHGVALATLRGDYDMENLVVHDSLARAPPTNARLLNQKIRKSPDHESTDSKADGNKAGEKTKSDSGGLDDASDMSSRPAKASKLSHGWAGAQDVLDYFVLRTSPERAQHIHRSMKLPIIGDLTLAEGVALGAFTTSGGTCESVPGLDLGIHGVMLENGTYAPAPTERVHSIASWIHQCVIERIEAGGIKAGPPLQARIYATLGNAFIAFEHCQKLTDTPFPFPWVQAVNIALLLFTLLAPLAVVGFIRNPFMATVLTFMAVAIHVTLNEVASDIEDPFHYDPNELPLPQMQYKLNERLLAVLYSDRPIAFTDVGGLTGPGNTVAVPSADAAPAAGGQPGGGAAAAGGGAAASKNMFTADKFANIAQAAFVAAGGETAEGTPLRRGFMGRSGAAGRAWPDMAGLQSFSTSRAHPAGNPANKWRRNTGSQGAGSAAAAPQLGAPGGASAAAVQQGQAANPPIPSTPAAPPADPVGAAEAAGGGTTSGATQPAGVEAISAAPRAATMVWAQKARAKAAANASAAASAQAQVPPARAVVPPAPQPSANVQDAPAQHAAGAWRARAVLAVSAERSAPERVDSAAPDMQHAGGHGVATPSVDSTRAAGAEQQSTQHGLREVIAEPGSPMRTGLRKYKSPE